MAGKAYLICTLATKDGDDIEMIIPFNNEGERDKAVKEKPWNRKPVHDWVGPDLPVHKGYHVREEEKHFVVYDAPASEVVEKPEPKGDTVEAQDEPETKSETIEDVAAENFHVISRSGSRKKSTKKGKK
jgi:hypothetical protein